MNRVAWFDGIFLRPQHFQQQEKFLENNALGRYQLVQPYWWGINKLRLNVDALDLGRVEIPELEAILPDGTLIQLADQQAPLFIELAETNTASTVYLAVPKEGQPERFVPLLAELADDHYQDVQAQIQLNQLNLQLLSKQPNEEQYSFLPLLKIDSVSADGAQLNYSYVPPLLDISDRSLITSILLEHVVQFNDAIDQTRTRLLEIYATTQKLDILQRHRLAKLNQLKCMLWRLVEQPLCHPYYLYSECLAALAELSAYGETPNELQVEPYQHNDLANSLGGLLTHLTQLISAYGEEYEVN